MLQKLLASKNPDDLRAANRLIREMVRRDDKRMQKLQKRLDELELVQNNVKLLSELLSHYKPEAGEQERLLIDVSTVRLFRGWEAWGFSIMLFGCCFVYTIMYLESLRCT